MSNIYQKMAAITAELRTVGKSLFVEAGKGKGYKAVSERDILDAVKPLEEKHGVYSYPCARRIMESQTLESESSYNGNTTKKTTFFTRIETTYRFVNVDDPTEYIETITFAEGIDTQDKGSGKAMTYGDKYALMKAYKISTGDDPDQTASHEEHYSAKVIVCEGCGGVLESVKKRDGSMWSVEDMERYGRRKYGKCLCAACMKAAEKNLGG
jgi:ribosomal protein L34E